MRRPTLGPSMKILSEEPPRHAKEIDPMEIDPSHDSTIQLLPLLPTITNQFRWTSGEEKRGGKVLFRAMPPFQLRTTLPPRRPETLGLPLVRPSSRANAGIARNRATPGKNAKSCKGKQQHPQGGNNPLRHNWWTGNLVIIEPILSTPSSRALLLSPPKNKTSLQQDSRRVRIFRMPDWFGLDQGD
jgi:hypothetical protein